MSTKEEYVVPGVDPQTNTPYRVRMEGKRDEFLPDVGALVPITVYWMRRLNDGSVTKATPPKKSAKSASTAA